MSKSLTSLWFFVYCFATSTSHEREPVIAFTQKFGSKSAPEKMAYIGRGLQDLSRGSSVASSYSRRHSRSRSRAKDDALSREPSALIVPSQDDEDTRDRWGGSVTGSSIGFMDGNNGTDFPAEPAAPAWLWDYYRVYTIEPEIYPARCYADKHAKLQKTNVPVDDKQRVSHVWCYDERSTMWKPVRFDTWVLEYVQLECSEHIARMVQELTDIVRRSEMNELPKETINLWKRILGKARTAQVAMGRMTGVTNVATTAAILLRDAEFFDQLDANRTILSFRNGVVDLKTSELRPRTSDDMLSYCLPYDFDADADTADINSFVDSVMSDEAARTVLQMHVGYWATGLTTEKRFYQLSTPPGYGKTSFIEIISRALGDYVVPSHVVPVSELMKRSRGEAGFEDSLSKALQKFPRPRVIFFDETDGGELDETIINAASSGHANIRLALRRKHMSAELLTILYAKFVFAGNRVLSIPASASGTAFRNTAPPFDTQFIEPSSYKPETMAHLRVKPRDAALCARLLSDDGRQGVVLWIVNGARRYLLNQDIPSNASWDKKRLDLLVLGDPFMRFISQTYTLTGAREDRIIFSRAVEEFSSGHRSVRFVDVGLSAAFDALRGILEPVEWEILEPYYGAGQPPADHPTKLVRGYSGLRIRRGGDPEYAQSLESARLRYIEEHQNADV